MPIENRDRVEQSPVETADDRVATGNNNFDIVQNNGLLAARDSQANSPIKQTSGGSAEALSSHGELVITSLKELIRTSLDDKPGQSVGQQRLFEAADRDQKSRVEKTICKDGVCYPKSAEAAPKGAFADLIKDQNDNSNESKADDSSNDGRRAGKRVTRGSIIAPSKSFKASEIDTNETPPAAAEVGSSNLPISEERRPGQGKPGDPGYRRGSSDSMDYADSQHDGVSSTAMVYHGASSAKECFNDAKARGVKVIVVESASWCGPCKHLHKETLPQIESAYQGKVAILNLNADIGSDHKVMQELGGRGGLPAMLVGTPAVGPGGELTLDKRQSRNGYMSAQELVGVINGQTKKDSPSYLDPDQLPHEKRKRIIRRRDED